MTLNLTPSQAARLQANLAQQDEPPAPKEAKPSKPRPPDQWRQGSFVWTWGAPWLRSHLLRRIDKHRCVSWCGIEFWREQVTWEPDGIKQGEVCAECEKGANL